MSDERSESARWAEDSVGLSRSFPRGHPLIIYNLAICATIGGFLFGYDTGIINGANLLIKEEFNLTNEWIENIVSSSTGAAAIFSIFGGVISDLIGRKSSIMLSAVIFTVGGVLMGVARNVHMLLAGRITVGVAIGMVSSVVPVYVAECAPTNIRGCLITLNQLFITMGIWLSAITAIAFYNFPHGWRFMLGLSAIPGVFQFLFFMGLPESPRYQVKKKKLAEAKMTLQRIRESTNVLPELQEIILSLEYERDVRMKGACKLYRRMFSTPHVRYALFIGCMLQIFQQFSGINTVVYYSSNILKSSGFNVRLAVWLSLIPFTVNFMATFIGMWAVEALGRKRALAASFLGIGLALIVLVIAFLPEYLSSHTTDIVHEKEYNVVGHCTKFKDCWHCTNDERCAFCGYRYGHSYVSNGSCVPAGLGPNAKRFASAGRCSHHQKEEMQGNENRRLVYTHGYCPSNFAWLAVAGFILFVLGFAPGAGPIPWTINAEIYPLWCRSVANSLATLCNWTCNFIISRSFFTVTKAITVWGTFLIFATVCFVASAFVFTLVPETRSCNLEQIEQLFMTDNELNDLRLRLQHGHESEPQNKATPKPKESPLEYASTRV